MKKACIYLGLFLAFAGCQHADQTGFAQEEIAAAPTPEAKISADQAAETGRVQAPPMLNPDREPADLPPTPIPKQFIRTADARFKVKEVAQSVTAIQKSLARYGGHVTHKNLGSQVQQSRTVEVSPDSSLLLTLYRLEANLTLRVPSQYLDSLVHDLTAQAVFIENQNLTAEDVSLQLLEKQLQRRRNQEFVSRLHSAPGQKTAKLTDATTAEEARLQKQLQADGALLAGLELKDRIEYSTLTLQLYQSPQLSRELVVNPNAANQLRDYEPGFGTKLLAALASGWEMLAWLLLALVKLWGVLALAVVAWFGFKQLRRWQAHAH